MTKTQLWGMAEAELGAWCKENGLPAFRGKQIFSWLQQKNIDDFNAMTNLPKNLQSELDNLADILQLCLDSGATKVLLPISSSVDIATVPAELFGKFTLIFYDSPTQAVFKALGVE